MPRAPSSSTEHIRKTCATCQELIAQQLDAREELARAMEAAPDGPRVPVLQDKVRKLQAETARQFLKAMDALVAKP